MDVIAPKEMMDVLHAPFTEAGFHFRWASLGMLQDLYRENPDHPRVREAQLAMETAISEWNDEQVADFLLNHLFELPVSTELQSRSPTELRQIFVEVYNYLFSSS